MKKEYLTHLRSLHTLVRRLVSISLISVLSSSASYAGGFALKLNSGILEGQANAGSAVISDPLAIFTNPASTIQQCNVGFAIQGTGLLPYVKFRGKTTDPLDPSVLLPVRSRQAGKNVIVPSAALAGRLHDRVALGIVVSSPFGSKLNYDKNWGGNRYVIKPSMETINITPTFALKLDDTFSVGGGVQVQQSQVELTSQVSSPNLIPQFLFQDMGTLSKAKAHGWGVGWTAGALWQPVCPLKIGFSYRSKISTTPKGYLSFKNVPVPFAASRFLQNTRVKTKIKYPQIFTLSASYDISSQWTVLGDIIRTNWSSLRQIILSTPVDSRADLIQLKWRDTWFFSAGVNYRYDTCWLFRGGIAYDMRASRTPYRVPGIPDNNKVWTALGLTYFWDDSLSTSLSYGHEFFQKQRINLLDANPGNAGKGNLTGHIREHVNLVSLQVNYQF